MRIIILFTLLFLTNIANSQALVNLNIQNKEIPKTKILLYGFEAKDDDLREDIEKVLQRVRKNLATTNLFDVSRKHDNSALIPYKADGKYNPYSLIDQIPDFNQYSKQGIGVMLIGDAALDDKGNLEIKMRMWDILDERQLFGKFYSAAPQNHDRMADIISDEIFKAVTGEKSGHFNSQITYIAESGRGLRRIKRVAMIDFDGGNRTYLTSGRDLVLTPIFLKKPGEIMFLRYIKEQKPQLYQMDIKNRIMKKVGGFLETTFSPTIHPKNADIILFSLIEDGNSNIYEMNLLTNRVSKITNSRSINTTPSYSPDGTQIVFASDRSGEQKIYIMDANGGNLRKITEGRGAYSKPVWSPDGSLIAFTRIKAGEFGIGLMTPDGANEKIIASGFLVEGAKWSPNGRYLIYSRQGSAYGRESIPKLYVIDILTGYERQIPTPRMEGASDPDWAMKW